MNRRPCAPRSARLVACAFAWMLLVAAAAPAYAASQRTFVRSDGADIGAFSLGAPCL